MIKIEGIEELKKEFSRMTDKEATRMMREILVKVAKPVREAAKREAPIADKPVTIKRKGKAGKIVEPGNLKKSIAIIKGRSKLYPNVHIGARAGDKRKNDGYYAHFVHDGHIFKQGGKNDGKEKSW
jgi:HK97 gp10 family phage protein